jgi:hypothetical protein
MSAKTGPGSKRSLPRVHSTTVIDVEWLGPLLGKPSTPSKRVKKVSPRILTRPSKGPRRDTIDVDSQWLIRTAPRERNAREERRKQLPFPSILVVKPRGQLPPSIPREDPESASIDSSASRVQAP